MASNRFRVGSSHVTRQSTDRALDSRPKGVVESVGRLHERLQSLGIYCPRRDKVALLFELASLLVGKTVFESLGVHLTSLLSNGAGRSVVDCMSMCRHRDADRPAASMTSSTW